MKNIHIPTIDELMRPEPIRKLDNGNYAFTKIIYQGKVLREVEFCPDYLEHKAEMSQKDWEKYSATKGWCVTDAEILYQCLLKAYELRNEAKIVKEFRMDMQEIFDSAEDTLPLTTLTKVSFGSGLDAVVSSLRPIKKRTPAILPEFTKDSQDYCTLVLAPEQPEKDLGKTIPLPRNARPLMKVLLGKGYEQAGAVFQYFSKLKDGNLREAILWTPTKTNRNSKMPVEMGIFDRGEFALTMEQPVLELGTPTLGVRIK